MMPLAHCRTRFLVNLWLRTLALCLGALFFLCAGSAHAGWLTGGIKESTIWNCPSIIFATDTNPAYTEFGAATYVGYWSDAGTRANNTYYTTVYFSGQGNSCSGQRVYAEIQLPPNTVLDISATNPVACFADGVRFTDASCPQVLPPSSLNQGAYWIPSADTAHANLWPLPQGHNWEFLIPVRTSVAQYANLSANIRVLDGNSSPWLFPTVGVNVAAGGGATLMPQSITFGANPGPRTFAASGTFTVSATASSGLPVTFTAKPPLTGPAVCSVSGTTVTMLTPGTCTIAANQAGNASYSAALEVTQDILIQAATLTPQTLTFGANPGPRSFTAGGTFVVSASSSSGTAGSPIVFSSLSGAVCSVSGSTVTMLSAGTCTIAADQAGSASYLPAAQVTQSVAINSYLAGVSWVAGKTMAAPRSTHTATLLPDGKVLVAGGTNAGVPLGSAELYDPNSNTWATATGSMTVARGYHTATALNAVGEVLVVGGRAGITTASAEIYYPTVTTSWSAVASMSVPRQGHTATRLPDGRVLVAGGYNEPDPRVAGTWLNSAEIYDRASNTWTTVAPMLAARSSHTATLLPNGKVLVVGGNGPSLLSSAEIYDPVANTWSTAGNAGARDSHTATLLANGMVLVVGGSGSTGAIATVALYDPASPTTWTAAAPLPTARYSHSASLMPNGQVLVTAGFGAVSALGDTLLYDPATNVWTSVAPPVYKRYGHTATLLANGKLMVAGGTVNVNGAVSLTNTIELIENANLSWGAAGALAHARASHTATLLPNGKVLAVGGHAPAGAPVVTTTAVANPGSVEIFDPVNGNFWMAGPDLATPRGGHTATLLTNGKLLVAGGVAGTSYPVGTESYDLALNTWSAGAPLVTGRAFHTASVLPSGDVLVVGGEGTGAVPTASAELYSTANNTWSSAGNLGAARADHTATLLSSGKILVTGGRGAGGVSLSSVELFNPATSLTTWATIATLGTPRHGHTATLLPDGMVLITGGYDSASGYLAETRIYNPGGTTLQTMWRVPPALTVPRAFHKAILLPNGKVLVVGGRTAAGVPVKTAELYDPVTISWTNLGEISLARSSSAITLLANGKVLVSGGLSGTVGQASGLSDLLDLGVLASRQSTVSSARVSSATGKVSLTGGGLTGDSEASGGNSQSSASNVPVVQLQRVDNGYVQWLKASRFSATSYVSDSPAILPTGYYRATPIVNGVPGNAMLFSFPSPPIAPDAPSIVSVVSATSAGQPALRVTFNAPNDNGGAAIDHYTVRCTSAGGVVVAPVTGTGSPIVVTGLAANTSYSCTLSATNSAGTGTASAAAPTMTRKGVNLASILMLLLD